MLLSGLHDLFRSSETFLKIPGTLVESELYSATSCGCVLGRRCGGRDREVKRILSPVNQMEESLGKKAG